jgi:hypothetical protein
LEAFFFFFPFLVIKTRLATSLRNPEATCCLDEETKYAISCSTRERRKKTNSNSKIKRKIVEKQKKGKRERERWGGERDTRDRKREMHGDKEDDEIAKRKKGQKRKNQKKEKKKGAKQRCKFFFAPIPASSRRQLHYLQSQFQFYGRGISEK